MKPSLCGGHLVGASAARERAHEAMNLAGAPLCDVLGRDLVVTDGGLPRLNPDPMDVDSISCYPFQ